MQKLARLIFAIAAGCGGSQSRTVPTTAPTSAMAEPASAAAPTCPNAILESGAQQGGACMEPAVLGQEVATSCEQYLQQHGWQRDDAAEKLIGSQTQKTLVCYRAPDAASPSH